MKLRIEYTDGEADDEIIIRCRSFDENVKKYCEAIEKLVDDKPAIVYCKGAHEYYLPSDCVLFFETEGDIVHAHTAKDMYEVRHRLYQLESILPAEFMRISKSVIANTAQILSLNRGIAASVSVGFFNSHKQVYASRLYYKELKTKLNGRRR